MSMVVEDPDLIKTFLEESFEHLENIEKDLLSLEKVSGKDRCDLINKIFRAAHTIKGSSSFFGLNSIRELSHKIEILLDLIRNVKIKFNEKHISLLLKCFDYLKELIDHYEKSNDLDISSYIKSLEEMIHHDEKQEKTKEVFGIFEDHSPKERPKEEAPSKAPKELLSLEPSLPKCSQENPKKHKKVNLYIEKII